MLNFFLPMAICLFLCVVLLQTKKTASLRQVMDKGGVAAAFAQ